jgi:hypothetical protein
VATIILPALSPSPSRIDHAVGSIEPLFDEVLIERIGMGFMVEFASTDAAVRDVAPDAAVDDLGMHSNCGRD